jgi:hypothetical protein
VGLGSARHAGEREETEDRMTGTATLDDLEPVKVWSRPVGVNDEGTVNLGCIIVKVARAREVKGDVVVQLVVELQNQHRRLVHQVTQEIIVGHKLTLNLPK